MSIDDLIEIAEIQKECILHSQEYGCKVRCLGCYNHVSDSTAIDAYNEIITILKEKKHDINTHTEQSGIS